MKLSLFLEDNISENPLRSLAQITIFTIACAIVAHLFCWTNTLFTHDSLMIVQNDWEHEIGIGRPFQQVYALFRGFVIAPWLIGMFGTMFLSLSNWLIVRVLGIKNSLLSLLTCALLTVNATITLLNATYITWFDIYMLALLCNCLAVSACRSKHWPHCALAALLICFSAGLYQSYIQVAVTLALALCIRLLLDNRNKQALSFALRFFFSAAIGIALYFVIQKGVFVLWGGQEFSSYNSVSSAFSSGTSPFRLLFWVWQDFFEKFLFPETYGILFAGICNVILLLVSIFSLVRYTRAHTKKSSIAIIVIIIACLPLGMSCINLAAYPAVHALMTFSYNLFYPIAFMLIQQNLTPIQEVRGSASNRRNAHLEGHQVAPTAVSILLAFCLTISNTIYANQVYLRKELEYQGTLSFMTRLAERMDTTEGYVPGETSVIIVGMPFTNKYFNNTRNGFPPDESQLPVDEGGQFTGYATGLKADIYIGASDKLTNYFTNILGEPLLLADVKALPRDEIQAGVDRVPNPFPRADCIALVNGILYVRLS